VSELEEIEAIKQLKYRYFRFLDTKRWSEMAECFVPEARSAYDEGRYAFEGRDAIIGFLEKALGRRSLVTLHQGHHPEITLTSPTTATGIWYLEDMVIDTERNTMLRGAAFYRDEYVRRDGAWKLAATGYRRTWEEVVDRSDLPSLKITRTLFSEQAD
jgi:hypothetical protein